MYEHGKRALSGPDHPNSKKTHCPKGHPYDKANTVYRETPYGQGWCRMCRTCLTQYAAELRYRRRQGLIPIRSRIGETCRNGHTLTPETILIMSDKTQGCKVCYDDRQVKYRPKRNARDKLRRLQLARGKVES